MAKRARVAVLAAAIGCTTLVATPSGQQRSAPPALTPERIGAWPNLAGTAPSGIAWAPDGQHVAFLWNDKGYPFLDLWIAAVAGGPPTRLTDMAAGEPAPVADDTSFAGLTAQTAARARRGISEAAWTPDGTALVFVYRGELYKVARAGGLPTQLTRSGGQKHALAFSPDGSVLSFVADNDLWFWYQKSGDRVAVTHVGRPSIGSVAGGRFGLPDVAVVSYEWSPDSRAVAVSVEDRSRVRKVLIPDYLGEETRVVAERRDFPGDNDVDRYVAIYGVQNGSFRRVPFEDSFDRRFVTTAWSPDSRRLLVDQYSENAVDRWLTLVDRDNLARRVLWQDERPTRTSSHWASAWRSDGQAVLFIGELDGRHRIFSIGIEGGEPRRLTEGDWSVIGESNPSPLIVSASAHAVFFIGTRKNEQERQVYRIPEGGGEVTQVTSLPGTHFPHLAPDGRTVATIRSEDVTPPELYVVDAQGGRPERQVTRSPTEDFQRYPWVRPRYVTFKSRTDGTTLFGRLFEPPNLDRTRKHPAILGPVYANTVRNRWGDREEWRGLYSTFQQFLVIEAGYIVLQVDVRGSVGHGREYRERLLRNFGGIDVEDLHSGAEFLGTLGYVDMDRLGIWGSSYGGLMTAMSLFKKPGVYKAGVASAPATNVWHATTGEVRVARRPDSDPESYRGSSAVMLGDRLQDHLMIVHGMEDDIVLFKDSVTLAEKLMMLGKRFDFVVVPNSVHPWSTRDYVAVYVLPKIVDFFDRHVGRGAR